jgi:4a-hydroxytetrahydrobiopterin dehydratase
MALLTPEQVRTELETTPGWSLEDEAIRRTVECRSFPEALMLMNAVGLLAERARHHPEMRNVYRRVTFVLSTHDAGGLTVKDFRLARAINELVG